MIQFPHEQYANLGRLAPEVVLCAFGILIMFVDPFVGAAHKRVLGWLGFVGAVVALARFISRRTTRAPPMTI